jgi:hypothetical protein
MNRKLHSRYELHTAAHGTAETLLSKLAAHIVRQSDAERAHYVIAQSWGVERKH